MIQKATYVFDLDGTLVDSAPDLVGALNVALALENLPPVSLGEVRQMVGQGARMLIRRGLARNNWTVDDSRFEEIVAAFLGHYELHIADESTLYPNVENVLQQIENEGHILAVCTNKPERLSHLVLEALGIKQRFAAICGADTFPVRKPDPLHLTGTIDRAGGVVGRSVMIGDSATDRNAASNAKVPCILLDYGYTDVPVTELNAEAVLSDFADIPETARALLG